MKSVLLFFFLTNIGFGHRIYSAESASRSFERGLEKSRRTVGAQRGKRAERRRKREEVSLEAN